MKDTWHELHENVTPINNVKVGKVRRMTTQQKIISYSFALAVCMPVLALSAGGSMWLFKALSS